MNETETVVQVFVRPLISGCTQNNKFQTQTQITGFLEFVNRFLLALARTLGHPVF